MKKITALLTKTILGLCFVASAFTMQAQVLDLESTTEGALLPRMTTAQRTAIATPNQSEMVYDTETKSFWYWEDMQWNELAAGGELPGNFYEEGSDSPGTAIPDNDPAGITSTITLTEAGVIDAETEVRVCLNITHTYVGDLDITLTAPDGTTIMNLTTDNGDGGDNFTNTCFSDQATIAIEAIVAADAPFTGLYRPETNYNALLGQSIAGDWILTVVDNAGSDTGTLDSWSIEISVEDPLVANILSDGDGDTKIQVEESPDEDMIRFDLEGTQAMRLENTTESKRTLHILPNDVQDTSGIALYENNIGTLGFEILFDGDGNQLEFFGSYGPGQDLLGPYMTINRDNGRVSIGGQDYAIGYELSVNGKIACEEVLVELKGSWPDYVFKPEYDLKTIEEVEAHINDNGHLPGVPSAQEVETNGIQVGEMNKILMEKVEELTLYIIDLEKRFKAIEAGQ